MAGNIQCKRRRKTQTTNWKPQLSNIKSVWNVMWSDNSNGIKIHPPVLMQSGVIPAVFLLCNTAVFWHQITNNILGQNNLKCHKLSWVITCLFYEHFVWPQTLSRVSESYELYITQPLGGDRDVLAAASTIFIQYNHGTQYFDLRILLIIWIHFWD